MAKVNSLKTSQKFKKTPIGEIPVDWEFMHLGKIVNKFINGGTPDTKNASYWNGHIPWITGADFENQKIKNTRRFITEEGVKNSSTNIIPKGSLLVVTRTGVGKLAVAPFDVAISQDVTALITDVHYINTFYLYWYLVYKSDRLKSLIQDKTINGSVRNKLASFIISLPPIQEQEKIAEILTSIDEKIDRTVSQKENLKKLKKGLKQVLLTGKVRVKTG